MDRSYVYSRFPSFVLVAFVCGITYLLWLSFSFMFQPQQTFKPFILSPGEDAIKHFAGSRDCGILQSDIYLAPYPLNPQVSPFCKNRAELLDAVSGGGRHGFDEPYVGKGCTYRWFPTPEICMILERFNAIVFIGDNLAQSIYAAFNILLREDLNLGGLQQWRMNEQDQTICKCDSQFLNPDCVEFSIRNSGEVWKNQFNDGKGSPYICSHRPHAYLRLENTVASPVMQDGFKDLTYNKPNPWQPSPVIFSFSQGSPLSIDTTEQAVDEWITLATAAERNIPMLSLGPISQGLNGTGNREVWQYQQDMAALAREKHFDVLGLYNLTLQAETADGDKFGQKVALVQAMMIINWLAMLETS